MKLKENQEKKVPHRGIEPAYITKTQSARSGTVQRQTHSTTMIPERYNLYSTDQIRYSTSAWTGQVGCVKTTTRNFVKLQKYDFLKQNSFMSIDELPYYSSFFYKLDLI